MTTQETPRILCVDDEPRVLQSLSRVLYRDFIVKIAVGPEDALKILAKDRDFAVVLSDMRMPGMDGTTFLAETRRILPHAVRIVLTGYADVDSAMAAINEGGVFRFLIKPCPRDGLVKALREAVEHHRIITSEKSLLEQSVRGATRMLSDVLSLVNPPAFGRGSRLESFVSQLLQRVTVEDSESIAIAAMLSQIGYLPVPQRTIEKIYKGRGLTPKERAAVARVPEIEKQLLGGIPRLAPVRNILKYREKHFNGEGPPRDGVAGKSIPVGARILKILLDFDVLEATGMSVGKALETMMETDGVYDPQLLNTFAEVYQESTELNIVRRVYVAQLRPGMILMEDMCTAEGRTLVSRGQRVTISLLERLNNYMDRKREEDEIVEIIEPLRVRIPKATTKDRGDRAKLHSVVAGTSGNNPQADPEDTSCRGEDGVLDERGEGQDVPSPEAGSPQEALSPGGEAGDRVADDPSPARSGESGEEGHSPDDEESGGGGDSRTSGEERPEDPEPPGRSDPRQASPTFGRPRWSERPRWSDRSRGRGPGAATDDGGPPRTAPAESEGGETSAERGGQEESNPELTP